jgi:hypothetical protein
MAARPARALKSWDRFRVPWPFARVLVSHGAPFTPAPTADVAPGTPAVASEGAAAGSESECARREFERALNELTRELRMKIGERI